MSAGNHARVRRALLAWYDTNRRPLPWRRGRDPYRIWVAEVMLQQTRIAVVVPAYRRFVRAFPTLSRLARADEEQVLSLWSGLGYYSRARALHRAARLLVGRGEASFPDDVERARRLPGVGPYTAAAVLSIAYEQPCAAVDGNVTRVLSRLHRLPRPDGRGEPYRSLATRLLDRGRPGDWNQALMELGETVCLPRAPLCDACPLRGLCLAHRHGEESAFPPARLRRARRRLHLELTILRDRSGRILLERGAFAYLPHLWLPPIKTVAAGEGSVRRATFRHAIVDRDFFVEVRRKIVSAAELRRRLHTGDRTERRLFTAAELAGIGRSSLLTKALRVVGIGSHPAVPEP